MEIRYASSNKDSKNYDTKRLREEYLIENLFIENLKDNGLKTAPQGPLRVASELLEYIEKYI